MEKHGRRGRVGVSARLTLGLLSGWLSVSGGACSSGTTGSSTQDLSATADLAMTAVEDMASAGATDLSVAADLSTPLPDLAGPGAQTGGPVWSRRMGSGDTDQANDVATDPSGNIFVVGEFRLSADLGGGALNSAGFIDAFVAKYAPDGTHLWSKRLGSNINEAAQAVVADSAGNVYVAGAFESSVDFGGGPITAMGSRDVFVVKYSPTGAHIWSKRLGGISDEAVQHLEFDPTGALLLVGQFTGIGDFGSGMVTSAGNTDVFVTKLDLAGNAVWAQRFGGLAAENGRGVAVDKAGNVVLTGSFNGSATFGGAALVSAGGQDAFVVKLDAAGAHVWSKRFGEFGTDAGVGAAFDSAGNVLLTGTFTSKIDFGLGPIAGGNDSWVAKLTPQGVPVWGIRCGGSLTTTVQDIAVDKLDQVLIGGGFSGNADFGGGFLSVTGGVNTDAFMAKFASNGSHVWSRNLGSSGNDGINAVAVDALLNPVVAGSATGSDFGGTPLGTAGGGLDIVVSKRLP